MIVKLRVFYNDIIYCYDVLSYSDSCRIELPNEFIIDCFKVHNHNYYFKAFFYRNKRIISDLHCNTKSKLLIEIQKLLKEELYDVVQIP